MKTTIISVITVIARAVRLDSLCPPLSNTVMVSAPLVVDTCVSYNLSRATITVTGIDPPPNIVVPPTSFSPPMRADVRRW